MTNIGQLRTSEPIEKAMRIIRDWLNKINVNGLSVSTNYDPRMNIAVLKFRYKDKDYEFRSTKQANCRLNMWGIARVMEYKVRASLMGIENFEQSMRPYMAIEDKSGTSNFNQVSMNEKNYIILGLSSLASNDEINKKYRELVRTFHPDMIVNSEEARKEFEKRLSEINMAFTEIKKERGL